MRTNRRGFLGLFGVSVVSAPLAAKVAADEVLAKQSGIQYLAPSGLSGASDGPPSMSAVSNMPYHHRVTKTIDYIKIFGIPDFIKKETRERSKWVGALDPDIACKKSWSMSVKIMTQRQRNYDNILASWEHAHSYTKGRSKLASLLGFEWPF